MGYTENDDMVRVDFFKSSGKWYTTEAIFWDRWSHNNGKDTELIHETFKRCLRNQLKGRLREMTAVCLHPNHEHACPLMVTNWEEE
jgi:hypothetical protein